MTVRASGFMVQGEGFAQRMSQRPCAPERDWYFIAEQPAPAPHLAHPEGCALRIVTVPRVSRSCEHFPDGFDLIVPSTLDAQVVFPVVWDSNFRRSVAACRGGRLVD